MGINWERTADAVKRRREKCNLTQDRLAAKIGVRWNTIARIEIGDRRPSIDLLEKIASVLGCRVRDLLQEEKPMLTQQRREPSFLGAPNFLRAAVVDAEAQGDETNYSNVGYTFAQMLNGSDLSEPAFEELREVFRQTRESVFTERLRKFIGQEFPACIELIPSRQRQQFVKGVIQGIATGCCDLESAIAEQIVELEREEEIRKRAED